MHKRIFISIPIPGEWQEKFADFDKQFSARNVRWTVKENIHITACFLGDVEEAHIGEIREKLKQICEHTKPFSLFFYKIDFAPPGMPPRMVWAVFKESGEYAALVKEMQETLKEFFAVEPHKELIPHATLARFKDPALANEMDIVVPKIELVSFDVNSIALMASRLDPAGVQYETLEIFSLAKKV